MTSEAGTGLAGPVMDPAVTTKRTLPPGRLGARITQTPDTYVIGHLGIARVTAPDWSLRVDGLVGVQGTWRRAELEPRKSGDFAWQRFAAIPRLGPGDYQVQARATDRRGQVQPQAGARNQVHSVSFTVE